MRVQVCFEKRQQETGKIRPSRPYTYETDLALQVGDIVLVPGNGSWRIPQAATVVALGSDWDGEAACVLRLLVRPAPAGPAG